MRNWRGDPFENGSYDRWKLASPWDDKPDPDEWERYVDSQWEKADRDRKREREDVLFRDEAAAWTAGLSKTGKAKAEPRCSGDPRLPSSTEQPT